MTERPKRHIVAAGWRTIECAIRKDGSMPARQFLDELAERELRKLDFLFRKLADHTKINNYEHFKKEEGDIWTFKCFQIRIGCFQIRERWILTHGFRKKCDRWPRSQLDRAIAIRTEHLMQEGVT